jgi:hypothetical protein
MRLDRCDGGHRCNYHLFLFLKESRLRMSQIAMLIIVFSIASFIIAGGLLLIDVIIAALDASAARKGR